MSGVFAVTFSVIFAYVADITQEHERSTAYGLVRRWSTKICVFKHLQCVYITQRSIYLWRIMPVFIYLISKLVKISCFCFAHLNSASPSRYQLPLLPAWLPAQPSEPTCLWHTVTRWWWSWPQPSPCSTSASSWWLYQSRCRRRWGQHHGEHPSPGSRQTPSL